MHRIIFIFIFLFNILYSNEVIVTGYGNSKDDALKRAFQNAVEQEIGVLIDTKTIVSNGKLIKNDILTFSNGFIESYKEISVNEQMGLWNVTIQAIVENQKLLSKIKEIDLKPKKIENTNKIYSRIVSQVKTKFDAEDFFLKFYKTFSYVPTESYSIEIINFHIDSDLATRNTVPISIKYHVVYKISQEEKNEQDKAYNLIKKLSIGSYTKKDTSVIGFFRHTNPSYPNEIEVYNYKYGWTTFGFPRSYSVIYPFKGYEGFGKYKRSRRGTISLYILDNKGNILKSFRKVSLNNEKNEKLYITSIASDLTLEFPPMKSTTVVFNFGEIVNDTLYWDMPISLLKRIAKIKGKIIWE